MTSKAEAWRPAIPDAPMPSHLAAMAVEGLVSVGVESLPDVGPMAALRTPDGICLLDAETARDLARSLVKCADVIDSYLAGATRPPADPELADMSPDGR